MAEAVAAMNSTIEETVKGVITALDILDTTRIGAETDLFDAGMTSHASVKLMLALEDEFDLEFPDEMLQREFFSTVGRISDCVAQITQAG